MDAFLTIESGGEAEIKVKGSRFIGLALPTGNVAEAQDFIRTSEKKFHDATHHCYAYRIIAHGQLIERANDAGEPGGTAGPPILSVLSGQNLFNLCVIVVRYFGGTKLGKGGLARAYGEATRTVLDQCTMVTHYDFSLLVLRFPYEGIGNVMHVVNQWKALVESSAYGQEVELSVKLPRSTVEAFKQKIIEVTSGRVTFK